MRASFVTAFASRSRDEWAAHFAGTDACVTPVLTFAEAARHPHLAARGTYVDVDGIQQAAAAPRFSRTPAGALQASAATGRLDPLEVLARWDAS